MGVKNTFEDYGSIAKWFHWGMFVAVVLMLISGHFMGDIPSRTLRSLTYTMHKASGITLFFLAALRLAWAFWNRRPSLPKKMHKIERFVAHFMQAALYLMLFIMPFSGWMFTSAKGYSISMFGLFNFPLAPIVGEKIVAHDWHTIHELVGWTLIVLISLHALAALKHHYYDKDDVLRSMFPKIRRVYYKFDGKTLRQHD